MRINKKFSILILLFVIVLTACSQNKQTKKNTINSGTASDKVTQATASSEDTKQTENKTPVIKNNGVLLGLKTEGSGSQKATYKTLWISNEKGNIAVSEGDNFITAPYGDTFYKLESQSFEAYKFSDDIKEEEKTKDAPLYSYDYKLNYDSIVSFPITSKAKTLYNKADVEKYIEKDGLPFQENSEELLYVGNKYVMTNAKGFSTGGGTLKISSEKISLYDLANLGVTPVDIKPFLEGDFDKSIKDLKSKFDEIKDTGNDMMSLKNTIDEKNIILGRSEGKWKSYAPLMEIYHHEGNGSYSTAILEKKELPLNVSTKLTVQDSLSLPFEKIKELVPEAVDAVSSPDGSMVVVLTNNKIFVFSNSADQVLKLMRTVNVDKSYSIILNQWATGSYTSAWTEKLGKYLKIVK